MNLLGCSQNSPDKLANIFFKKLNIKPKTLKFVSSADVLPESPDHKYYFFLTPFAVKRSLSVINSEVYKGTIGVVFSCPVDLYPYEGITPLDYLEATDLHIDAFNYIGMRRSLLKQGDSTITFETHNYLDKVLTKVRSSKSILTKLMSFVYTMPSSTHQKPVKELACSWLNSGQGDGDLKIRMDKLSKQVHLSDKQKQRFLDILLSEDASLYKNALIKCLNITDVDAEPFYRVVNKFKVSAYELRYVKAVCSKLKDR